VILVDTNVVSEPLKPQGDRRVAEWLDRQATRTLYISSVSVAEILFGVRSLPAGKRREALATAFEREILRLFAGRIVPFDLAAAPG
jgi:predicted nucleic acid-binding protein